MRRTRPKPRTRPSAAAFRSAILRWFGAHGRDLPWRRTHDPWTVLVSEVMLQQTQVDRVVPKFLDFVRRWPSPRVLADSPLRDVLAAWSGLGYNRRAARLRDAATAVVSRHGGRMPDTVEALEALPGVGRYTARAVASFAFGKDVTLWDTNVRRIVTRYFFGGEFARSPRDEDFEEVLAAALPPGRSRDWHGALMDFGSAVCVSRTPACASCPLARACLAAPSFLAGREPRRRMVRAQPKFEGSTRQARGAVVRHLMAAGPAGMRETDLSRLLGRRDLRPVLDVLVAEGMVVRRRGRYLLP